MLYDLLGDPDTLARAAGVTEPSALDDARVALRRRHYADDALRRGLRRA